MSPANVGQGAAWEKCEIAFIANELYFILKASKALLIAVFQ
jgi:hypothetical protein